MKRGLLVLALLVGLACTAGPAAALPPGGAGSDTPGTSASVSPGSLRAGSAISFRLSGFPAGEIAYVKIDDGRFCSKKGVHGACVVHQQRISSGGTVSGSFVLSADLEPGRHWLRFLASKEMKDAQGNYLGIKGYTCRGNSDFTIVTASIGTSSGSSSGSTSGAVTGTGTEQAPTAGATVGTSTSGTTTTGSDDSAAVVAAGRVLAVAPPASLPSVAPTSSPTPDAVAAAPAVRTVRAETREEPLPVIGTLGLVLLAGLAGGWVLRTRRVRR